MFWMGVDKLAGYAFAFGIFQDYYSSHPPFEGSGHIAVIGTCAMVSRHGIADGIGCN
jgi:hypothetical protein